MSFFRLPRYLMSSRQTASLVIIGLFTLCLATQAFSAPTQFVGTGNFYEYIPTPLGLSWDDSRAAAQGMTFMGVNGDLATIFSQGEQDFVFGLLTGVSTSVWLGGTDEAIEGEWRWVSGEQFWSGGESGGPVGGRYNNFFRNPNDPSVGEPNDFDGVEDRLAMFGPDTSQIGGTGIWVDLRNNPSCGSGRFTVCGYVVEYNKSPSTVPVPSAMLLFGTGLIGMVAWRWNRR